MSCIYHRLFFLLLNLINMIPVNHVKNYVKFYTKKSVSMELSINLYRGVV
jgi:hypothetical protein